MRVQVSSLLGRQGCVVLGGQVEHKKLVPTRESQFSLVRLWGR